MGSGELSCTFHCGEQMGGGQLLIVHVVNGCFDRGNSARISGLEQGGDLVHVELDLALLEPGCRDEPSGFVALEGALGSSQVRVDDPDLRDTHFFVFGEFVLEALDGVFGA